jgi:hypothetical protein
MALLVTDAVAVAFKSMSQLVRNGSGNDVEDTLSPRSVPEAPTSPTRAAGPFLIPLPERNRPSPKKLETSS